MQLKYEHLSFGDLDVDDRAYTLRIESLLQWGTIALHDLWFGCGPKWRI